MLNPPKYKWFVCVETQYFLGFVVIAHKTRVRSPILVFWKRRQAGYGNSCDLECRLFCADNTSCNPVNKVSFWELILFMADLDGNEVLVMLATHFGLWLRAILRA